MKTRIVPLAVAALGTLGGAAALAQSSAAPQAPVTPAVTVVAQRVPVVTVLAPRETPRGAAADKRRQAPATIGKAVDADGDGLADAPAAPAREARTSPSSDKRAAPAAAASAAPAADCAEKDPRKAPRSSCAKGTTNPIYQDKSAQGRNPLHEP